MMDDMPGPQKADAMASAVHPVVTDVDAERAEDPDPDRARIERRDRKMIEDERVAADDPRGHAHAEHLLRDSAAQAVHGVLEAGDALVLRARDPELDADREEEQGNGEGDQTRAHDRRVALMALQR